MTVLETTEVVLSVLAGIGVLIAGVGYGYAQWKKGNNSVQAESDAATQRLEETYRSIIEANDKRFANVEAEHKDNLIKISKLQGVVEEQNKQRKWFEGIFVVALENYFAANPKLAAELQSKLQSSSQNN